MLRARKKQKMADKEKPVAEGWRICSDCGTTVRIEIQELSEEEKTRALEYVLAHPEDDHRMMAAALAKEFGHPVLSSDLFHLKRNHAVAVIFENVEKIFED